MNELLFKRKHYPIPMFLCFCALTDKKQTTRTLYLEKTNKQLEKTNKNRQFSFNYEKNKWKKNNEKSTIIQANKLKQLVFNGIIKENTKKRKKANEPQK